MNVDVTLRGTFGTDAGELARQKVEAVSHLTGRPILHAHVILDRIANPSVDHPVVAEASLDVNGRMIHAKAAAGTARDAIDLLQDRLRRQLTDLN